MSENQNTPPANPQGGNQRQRIEPFIVEFSDDCCRNFSFNTPPLQGLEVRGRWDVAKLAQREQGMRDLGTAGNRIPTPMPGMYLEVDVRKRRIELSDPLGTTKEGIAALERFNRVAKDFPALRKGDSPQVAHPTRPYEIDDDQMKTLLLELLRKNDAGCLIVIKGSLPTREMVLGLAGDELYDPQNTSAEKPRLKKDLDAHRDRLRAAGVA